MANEALDDVALRLVVGWLNIYRGSRVESGHVAFVEVDVFRRSVCGEYKLLALWDHRIEDAEQRVERAGFALEPLDIVDEQYIRLLEIALKVLEALLIDALFNCSV